MSAEIQPDSLESDSSEKRGSYFRNWLSLTGLLIAVGGFFSFFLLFLLDSIAHFSNPYMGVAIYLVTPAVIFLGLLLAILGWLVQHRFFIRGKAIVAPQPLRIDLSRPRHRRLLGFFAGGGVLFLLFAAVASYHTYHFTESVQFCGQACHTVMKPELVTYQHSPHARVACTECHIGPGATWFVRSKLSGIYQVYATLADKFPRPIPTPIKNLRPAQDTCEQCHWPKAFVGNVDKTYSHYLADESNTPYTVRLSLKVGGADPSHGPVGGIHWHMNVGNKVEYYATDNERQVIPWVRITDSQGVVTVYQTSDLTHEPPKDAIRRMDCMDCHNRPAHKYGKPDAAVDLAMHLGRIDPAIPYVKKNCVAVLTESYESTDEALQQIATKLANEYPDDSRLRPVIDIVQEIYRENFFPEMNADWKAYPDHIGHKEWPGCFRCHDGEHKTADGKKMIKANDCNACHIILAQGSGEQLDKLSPKGQPFEHPGGEFGEIKCNECHSGGLQ